MSGVVNYRIGHYETIHSRKLNEERKLLIHFPDNYETSLNKYPVLYFLDAEGTQRFIQSIKAITFFSEAITLFKYAVDNYSCSWYIYYNLAEAYMKNGEIDIAIKNYKKSLELNPNNDKARHMLKKLTKKNNLKERIK